MANANTIYKPFVKPRELNQGGTSTSEVAFTSDGTIPVILPFPQGSELAGGSGTSGYISRFTIRAGGRVTGGTTTNYTPQLQFGTSATAASNTDICSGSAIAVNSVSGFWLVEVDAWITIAGLLDGFMRFGVSGSTRTFTDWAVFSNAVSTATPTGTGATAQGFVVTGTFSSGNASNASYLDIFQLDVL
jgi:hypothetical protein